MGSWQSSVQFLGVVFGGGFFMLPRCQMRVYIIYIFIFPSPHAMTQWDGVAVVKSCYYIFWLDTFTKLLLSLKLALGMPRADTSLRQCMCNRFETFRTMKRCGERTTQRSLFGVDCKWLLSHHQETVSNFNELGESTRATAADMHFFNDINLRWRHVKIFPNICAIVEIDGIDFDSINIES